MDKAKSFRLNPSGGSHVEDPLVTGIFPSMASQLPVLVKDCHCLPRLLVKLGQDSLLVAFQYSPQSAKFTVRKEQAGKTLTLCQKEKEAFQGEDIFDHPYPFRIAMSRRGRC